MTSIWRGVCFWTRLVARWGRQSVLSVSVSVRVSVSMSLGSCRSFRASYLIPTAFTHKECPL